MANTKEEALRVSGDVELVRSFGVDDRCSALCDEAVPEVSDGVAELLLEDSVLESSLSWLALKSVEFATRELREVPRNPALEVWPKLKIDGDVLLGTVLVKLGIADCVEGTTESKMNESSLLDSVEEYLCWED